MSSIIRQRDDRDLHQLQQAFERHNVLSETLSDSVEKLSRSVMLIDPDQIDRHSDDSNRVKHLRDLIDAIPGGVVVLDPQGMVIEANLAATALLGENINQKPWRDIVNHTFLPELDQGELKTADGRQFSISTRPLGFQPGQIVLLSDVTQTRQLQRAAQQNLHLMTMGKMMASLAHQIRTPLASTMLYLSQITEGNLDPETRQSFNTKALARVRHIEKMINDMLVFAHGGHFNMSQFSVAELFGDLQEQLSPQLALRKARLVILGDDTKAQLRGNKDAILGALCNLCMNALDAADHHARIDISVKLGLRGMLVITVRDNGCGFNAKVRRHLFDPFFSTKVDGTGLGLAVVKSVIESHQGRIAVVSKPDKGTRFRIFLPCQQGMKSQVSNVADSTHADNSSS